MTTARRVTEKAAIGDDRRWYSVETFLVEARRQGAPISRGVAYDGIRRGVIPHVRVGRRIVIPADALDRMLSQPASPMVPDEARTA